MAKQIYMIRMGQTMQEGTIIKWRKAEGEYVEKGEDLYDMEYDKASAVAAAKNSGYLHIVVGEGETVPVTTVVGLLLEQGEAIPGAPAPQASEEAPAPQGPVKASPLVKKFAKENGVDLNQVPLKPGCAMLRKEDVEEYLKNAGARQTVTPLARKMADDNGVDVETLNVEGRAYAADVAAAIARDKPAPAQAEATPMSGLRKTIARRMKESYFDCPVVTYMAEADTTRLNAFYQTAREALKPEGLRLTMTDFLILACAKALTNKPYMNVSVEGDAIITKKTVNIGLAVAIEDGLLVPVMRNADKLTLREIARERARLVEGAKARTLAPDDMAGGTFTITNLGAKGVDFFTPILNPPETAILGVGRSCDKVVVERGEMVIRGRMGLSLTADHRAIDGAPAAEFVQELVRLLDNPVALVI